MAAQTSHHDTNTLRKLKVAIIGSGNIGTDLLVKVQRSAHLHCTAFIGRNFRSPGMQKAQALNVNISQDSIQYIIDNPKSCDLVFDATSAKDQKLHAPILKDLGIKCIDLTPAKLGMLCVPAVNLSACVNQDNINMITCGGQASIPLAYCVGQTHQEIDYIEVVSSIASRSAGAATRLNLDEYIHTTEQAIGEFSGAQKFKAILNLNPAQPCIDMQTTVFAKVKNPNMDALKKSVMNMVETIRSYVPGYELIIEPVLENNRIVIMVRVKGLGDYLPPYAGNLDIINCAAIALAEEFAKQRVSEMAKK